MESMSITDRLTGNSSTIDVDLLLEECKVVILRSMGHSIWVSFVDNVDEGMSWERQSVQKV